MKKKLRKLAALGLSFIMICSLLAACGSTKAPEENSAQGNGDENSGNMEEEVSGESATKGESAGDDALTVGVVIWSTDDGLGADSKKALDAVAGELGINLIYRTGSYDAENQTTDIENLIAAGVDGIMCVVIVDTATDELLKVCEEADVDYQVFFRNIMDEEAYNYCMASDHFAGYICEDEAAAGVDMVDELITQGCTTFGLINREAGNGVIDRRQQGTMEYLQEKGLTYYVSTNTSTATATEMVDATDQLLAAYPDIDGLILSSGSNGAIDAIITDLEGTDIKLTSFDTPADIEGAFQAGNLCMLTTGAQIDPVYALINLYCKMSGNPKSETPTEYGSNYIYMKSAEDAQTYEKYFGEFNTYTAEEIKAMVDMDLDSFMNEMSNYSLEMVADKMK